MTNCCENYAEISPQNRCHGAVAGANLLMPNNILARPLNTKKPQQTHNAIVVRVVTNANRNALYEETGVSYIRISVSISSAIRHGGFFFYLWNDMVHLENNCKKKSKLQYKPKCICLDAMNFKQYKKVTKMF